MYMAFAEMRMQDLVQNITRPVCVVSPLDCACYDDGFSRQAKHHRQSL